jgi:hypothetical protein
MPEENTVRNGELNDGGNDVAPLVDFLAPLTRAMLDVKSSAAIAALSDSQATVRLCLEW